MGSAMRKMGVYLGLLEDTERYEDEYYDEYDDQPARREERREVRPAPVANLAEHRRPHAAPASGVVAELSRITTLHPRTYNVFLLSPPNVTVAAEDKARIAEDGFFNQS